MLGGRVGDYGYSLLLRVFFETADGGYYSPMFEDCFELLPIPEFIGRLRRKDIAALYRYDRVPCRCCRGALSKYLPNDYILLNGSSYNVNEIIAHWDPRLDIGVYSDYWRVAGGRIPRQFKEHKGSYIFFAAGLARYPHNFFRKRKDFTEIRRAFVNSRRGVFVVAYMKVDEIVDLTEIASRLDIDVGKEGDEKVWEYAIKEYGARVAATPHYARGTDLPVVILSEKGHFGYFKKPLPIMTWVNGRKLLTDYSYTFGVKKFEDRVRHKLFTPSETEEIVKLLGKEDILLNCNEL